MRTLAPPTARGWEYLLGDGHDWDSELAGLGDLLAEKLRAPSVEAGPLDLVIHPSNLWLTIHESIGHATELDRALGYEANYAGTSFATPDLVGSLRYGSPVMHVTGDRTEPTGSRPPAGTTRAWRPPAGTSSATGSSSATSSTGRWPPRCRTSPSTAAGPTAAPTPTPPARAAAADGERVPAAGRGRPEHRGAHRARRAGPVRRGRPVLVDRHAALQLQFTGQQFHRIVDGELAGQVRDVAYQATTTDFWGAMEAVGGPQTWELGGAFNCGKAQPGQVAAVSHGCPTALFRGIRVLNTSEEGA